MLNINILWQEVQKQEPTAYMVCASTCQVFVDDQCISDSPSMTTAIEQAWLKLCKPQEPSHVTPA
jgi:hypothetical protein